MQLNNADLIHNFYSQIFFTICLVAIASSAPHGEHHGFESKIKHEYSSGGHGGHEMSGGHSDGGHSDGGHSSGHEALPGAGSWGHGGSGHDHVDYADHHPEYKFEYGVKDSHTKDHHSAWEHRDGDKVHGEYTLDEADGTKRIVTYHADKKGGFQAEVQRIGHPHYDAPKAHGRQLQQILPDYQRRTSSLKNQID